MVMLDLVKPLTNGKAEFEVLSWFGITDTLYPADEKDIGKVSDVTEEDTVLCPHCEAYNLFP